jgi:hypothetical protein
MYDLTMKRFDAPQIPQDYGFLATSRLSESVI